MPGRKEGKERRGEVLNNPLANDGCEMLNVKERPLKCNKYVVGDIHYSSAYLTTTTAVGKEVQLCSVYADLRKKVKEKAS